MRSIIRTERSDGRESRVEIAGAARVLAKAFFRRPTKEHEKKIAAWLEEGQELATGFCIYRIDRGAG